MFNNCSLWRSCTKETSSPYLIVLSSSYVFYVDDSLMKKDNLSLWHLRPDDCPSVFDFFPPIHEGRTEQRNKIRGGCTPWLKTLHTLQMRHSHLHTSFCKQDLLPRLITKRLKPTVNLSLDCVGTGNCSSSRRFKRRNQQIVAAPPWLANMSETSILLLHTPHYLCLITFQRSLSSLRRLAKPRCLRIPPHAQFNICWK